MATLDSIADEIGYSRNELMQSMVKFGLTNRDWRNEGLTAHKRLPRYEVNPMATKPPSAAQLAARARFAEMARSGSLNRKRQIAAKQNASVKRKANPTPVVVETLLKQLGGNKFMVMTGSKVFDYGPNMLTLKLPTNKSKANYLDIVYHPGKDLYTMTFRRVFNRGLDSKRLVEYDDLYADQLQEVFTLATGMETSLGTLGRRTNPVKKTVSQKISQLVHEGYPQKQAVAVALNEQRAGKVKRNPARKTPVRMVHAYALVCMHPEPHTIALVDTLAHAKEIAREYSDRHNVPVAIRSIDVHAAHFIP